MRTIPCAPSPTLRHAILGFLSTTTSTGYDLKVRFDGSVRQFWTADHPRSTVFSRSWRRMTWSTSRSSPSPTAPIVRCITSPQAAPPRTIAGSRRRSMRTPCGNRSCCGYSSPDASARRVSPNSSMRASLRQNSSSLSSALSAPRAVNGPAELERMLRLATLESGIRHTQAEIDWLADLRRSVTALGEKKRNDSANHPNSRASGRDRPRRNCPLPARSRERGAVGSCGLGLRRAGFWGTASTPVRVLSGLLVPLLALSARGNFAHASRWENLLMGPLALVLSALCAVVAQSRIVRSKRNRVAMVPLRQHRCASRGTFLTGGDNQAVTRRSPGPPRHAIEHSSSAGGRRCRGPSR